MFESMPEGGTTTVKSGKYGPYNQVRREVRTRWVLNPESEGPKVVVDLTTYHYADSKQFSTSLTWGTVEPAVEGSTFMVETWSSDHTMLRTHVRPVARYSVKAMEAHHEYALSVVANRWDHARVVFAEAAERSGLTGVEA